MNPLNVFVAYDADDAGSKVGKARLANDADEIRRVSQALDAGNEIFKSWALSTGGNVVEAGGDEGLIEIPVVSLTELESTRNNYESCVGATVSVGVGRQIDQASKALLQAKLTGKNRVCFFDEETDKVVAAAADKPEQQKIVEQYLTKAEAPAGRQCGHRSGMYFQQTYACTKAHNHSGAHGAQSRPDVKGKRDEIRWHTAEAGSKPQPMVMEKADGDDHPKGQNHQGKGRTDAVAPSRQHGEHSEGEVARNAAEVPKAKGAPANHEENFRAAAEDQDKRDRVNKLQTSGDMTALKEKVAGALKAIQPQLGALKELKTSQPAAYQSLVGLVQSVIAIARGLQDADSTLTKAEKAPKVWRTASDWGNGISIPSQNHPERKQYDKNFLAAVATHFAGGNLRALRPVKVATSEVTGGNSRGVTNPDRFHLYTKMFRAGDRVPPVVVQRTAGGQWSLLDGTHRLAGAVEAGAPEMDALELRAAPMKKAQTKFEAEQPFNAKQAGDPSYLEQFAQPWSYRIGMIDPSNSNRTWTYEPKFPVSQLGTGFKGYLQDEREDAESSGYAKPGEDAYAHLKDWLKTPEKQPVVLFQHKNGTFHPADGSHRLGAAEEGGITHVPAVVARLNPEMKKAISTLPTGKPAAPGKERNGPIFANQHLNEKAFRQTFDYSHLLPEGEKGDMELLVHHEGIHTPGMPHPTRDEKVTAELHNKGAFENRLPGGGRPIPVGHVNGYIRHAGHVAQFNEDTSPYPETSIEPHSDLAETHHGRGLGTAMYEALYAHAHNALGINAVRGGIHSRDADALHNRLSRKHGFEYHAPAEMTLEEEKAERRRALLDENDTDPYPHPEYRYALKAELDPNAATDDDSKIVGPGRYVVFERAQAQKTEMEPDEAPPAEDVLDKGALPPHATSHRRLILPSGTIHNGEIKVTHADGKSSWKGVRAGQIQAQEPDAPYGGSNSHPVSSREPGSR